MSPVTPAMLLAVDVGGTKTDLARFDRAGGPNAPRERRQLPSAGFPGLAELVRAYLGDLSRSAGAAAVRAVCVDVAGPVVDGRAVLPNLGWSVDASALSDALGLPVLALLNDLEATAHAIPLLGAGDLFTVQAGTARPDGPIAVISPGTGLGEATATWHAGRLHVQPSEGGHADFAPADADQVALLEAAWGRFDHVSWERVCSGRGIPVLYAHARARGTVPEAPYVAAAVAATADPTPVVVEAGTGPAPDRLCRATLELFLAILGAEAGNLALRAVATGGVFVAGGLPPRLLELFPGSRFLERFRAKGREQALVREVPVHVVLEQVALLGSARRGLELLEELTP